MVPDIYGIIGQHSAMNFRSSSDVPERKCFSKMNSNIFITDRVILLRHCAQFLTNTVSFNTLSERHLHEILVKEGSTYLTKITPDARLSSGQLRSKNASSLYTRELVPEITARLKNTGGPFTQFYNLAEIESLESLLLES